MTLLIEKHSSRGRNPQIDVLGLLNRFLKDETMENNPLSSLFVPQNMTIFLNRGAKAVKRHKYSLRDPHGYQD